jgi:hypothetical protein
VTESEFQAETSLPTETFPWPPREGESVLDALAATWKESVFQPAAFFRRMPGEYDFGWVLGYYLIIGVIGAGISLFWEMVLGPSLAERWLPAGAEAGNPFVDFLLSPLWLFVALYIAAGVVHLVLLIVRGAHHGFGKTLRVFCFSPGPQLFAVIPFLGTAVGGVWSLVITVIGLREAHATSTGKALAAVLIPLFFFMMLVALMVIAGMLVGLGRAVG